MASIVAECRRTVCVVLAVSHLACTSWRAQSVPVPQVLAEQEVGQLRVRLVDSTRIVLRDPLMQGDSLVGGVAVMRAGQFTGSQRRAVPLDSVVRVETRHVSAVKTGFLVVGSLVVVGLAAFGIWYASCVSAGDC